MPDKQRAMEIISAMPESVSFLEILQTLNIWFSEQRADADINAGRYYTTDEAKQRVRELAKT